MFENPDTDTALVEGLLSARDALAHYNDLKHASDSCVGHTWSEEGDSYTLVRTSPPKVGDRSVAYQLHETLEDGDSQTMQIVLVLRGTVGESYIAFPVPYNGAVATSDELSVENYYVMVGKGDQKVVRELATPSGQRV